jgi:hypothetical protein
MKLKDLPDDFTPEQFRQLDKESLDAVQYVRRRWLCQVKNCKNGTHVRDYGLEPFNPRGIWAFLDRNSKGATENPRNYWMGPNNYWLCSKHNALFKRLIKRFEIDHIFAKVMDVEKEVVVDIPGASGLDVVKQIETR